MWRDRLVSLTASLAGCKQSRHHVSIRAIIQAKYCIMNHNGFIKPADRLTAKQPGAFGTVNKLDVPLFCLHSAVRRKQLLYRRVIGRRGLGYVYIYIYIYIV